jgi:hypothetical protein
MASIHKFVVVCSGPFRGWLGNEKLPHQFKRTHVAWLAKISA